MPCYNTSGGYLSASTAEVLANVDASLARGLGGIKLKVGQPELKKDLERVAAVREHLLSLGVTAERIRVRAMGDSAPRARCDEASLQGAALRDCLLPDRRVEVTVRTRRP